MTDDSRAAAVDALATVLVPVSDQDAAIVFYRDLDGNSLLLVQRP